MANKRRKGSPPSNHPPPKPNVLDPEQRPKGRVVQTVTMQQITFSGPLPPPELTRQYEEIHKGFTQRLLDQHQAEQKHRHRMEERFLEEHVRLAARGQVLGLVGALAVVGAGTAIGILGGAAAGAATVAVGTASFVLAYMYGKRQDARASSPELPPERSALPPPSSGEPDES